MSYGHSGHATGGARSDTKALGIAALVCGIVGLFVLSLILGPVAIVLGWLAMGRKWRGGSPSIPVAAVVLGVIDTVLALIWLATSSGMGMIG